MFNVRFTAHISKEARRKAAFTIADYPKKVIDLLANVAIGDSWISTLAIMVHKFDEKKLRSDIREHRILIFMRSYWILKNIMKEISDLSVGKVKK